MTQEQRREVMNARETLKREGYETVAQFIESAMLELFPPPPAPAPPAAPLPCPCCGAAQTTRPVVGARQWQRCDDCGCYWNAGRQVPCPACADAPLAADNCRAALRLAEQERDAAANRAEAAEKSRDDYRTAAMNAERWADNWQDEARTMTSNRDYWRNMHTRAVEQAAVMQARAEAAEPAKTPAEAKPPAEVQALNAAVTRLSADLLSARTELASVGNTMDALRQERNTLKLERDCLRGGMAALRNDLQVVTLEHDNLRVELQDWKSMGTTTRPPEDTLVAQGHRTLHSLAMAVCLAEVAKDARQQLALAEWADAACKTMDRASGEGA